VDKVLLGRNLIGALFSPASYQSVDASCMYVISGPFKATVSSKVTT
jgi:hypothetical protein